MIPSFVFSNTKIKALTTEPLGYLKDRCVSRHFLPRMQHPLAQQCLCLREIPSAPTQIDLAREKPLSRLAAILDHSNLSDGFGCGGGWVENLHIILHKSDGCGRTKKLVYPQVAAETAGVDV